MSQQHFSRSFSSRLAGLLWVVVELFTLLHCSRSAATSSVHSLAPLFPGVFFSGVPKGPRQWEWPSFFIVAAALEVADLPSGDHAGAQSALQQWLAAPSVRSKAVPLQAYVVARGGGKNIEEPPFPQTPIHTSNESATSNGLSNAPRHAHLAGVVNASHPEKATSLSHQRLRGRYVVVAHRSSSRQVISRSSALGATSSRPEGLFSHLEGEERGSHHAGEALSTFPEQRRAFPEVELRSLLSGAMRMSRLSQRESGASSHTATTASEEQKGMDGVDVETHMIDDHHTLVYLPFSITAIPSLASADQDSAGSDMQWSILDVFASATGISLKLSPDLRQYNNTVEQLSSEGAGENSTTPQRLLVGLWTARGAATLVREELASSPRLQRLAKAPWNCTTRFGTVSEAGSVVIVSIDLYNGQHGNRSVAEGSAAVSCDVPSVLQALAAHPSVRWIERVAQSATLLNTLGVGILQRGVCSTFLTEAESHSSSSPALNARPFLEGGWDGTGEILTIADTGVDVKSCFFRDQDEEVAYYPKMNPKHRKILTYQPQDDGHGKTDATDVVGGHGTHVAGSAVGAALSPSAGSLGGFDAYNGVAPGAKLYMRDLGPAGAPSLVVPAVAIELFTSPFNAGSRISSNSWGFVVHSKHYTALERLIDRFVVEYEDMLILFASGNAPATGLYSPSTAKNVLTVGSHLNSQNILSQNLVSSFSSSGPTGDGRRKPDLVAPGGGGVTTIRSANSARTETCAVAGKSGTSMATGLVGGAAAVVRQYLREVYLISSPSAALMKAVLTHSTAYLSDAPRRSGLGRLDLSRLLVPHKAISATHPLTWMVDRTVVMDEGTHQYCFVVRAPPSSPDSCAANFSSLLKATLVWSDPADAVEGSMRTQINDLDLMVVRQDGQTFYSSADWMGKEEKDRNNNVEQVRVPWMSQTESRGDTVLRVIVYGSEVRTATGQSYALVVSGPQLELIKHCSDVFEASPKSSVSVVGSFFCPMNCTGHGTCDTETYSCRCNPEYRSVDCADCNSEYLCNGHGTCSSDSLTCTCNANGHFADAHCTTCQEGWYGPGCDFNCSCENGGSCDFVTGTCICPQDSTVGGTGCYSGAHCEYCCPNFIGDQCSKRSYDCDVSGAVVVVDGVDGGYIRVNEYGTYPYNTVCNWLITAPEGKSVELEYLSYNIESYDSLVLYDVFSDKTFQLLREDSGKMGDPFVVVSTERQLRLQFISDWDVVMEGFLLHYRFIVGCPNCRKLPLEHWRCGARLALPKTLCICDVGFGSWQCDVNTSDALYQNAELQRTGLSPDDIGSSEQTRWRHPSLPLWTAEAILPIQADEGSVDGTSWLVTGGTARLPILMNGFSVLFFPEHVTLPEAPIATGIVDDRDYYNAEEKTAYVELSLTFSADSLKVLRYAKSTGMMLVASAILSEERNDASVLRSSFNRSILIQSDFLCPDPSVVQLTVPLHRLTTAALRATTKTSHSIPNSASTTASSVWTGGISIAFLWNSTLSSNSSFHEDVAEAFVTAKRIFFDAKPTTSNSSANSRLKVQLSCVAPTTATALETTRVTSGEAFTATASRPLNRLSVLFVLLICGISALVGGVSGVLFGFSEADKLPMHRATYVTVEPMGAEMDSFNELPYTDTNQQVTL